MNENKNPIRKHSLRQTALRRIRSSLFFPFALAGVGLCHAKSLGAMPQAQPATQAQPVSIKIANAPVPMRILVLSPADSDSELQVICLFASDPSNTLHGSLVEMNEKLRGLLDRVRNPDLFRGELGETLIITPASGTIAAKKLLIIGLGDSETFSPARMDLVGSIVYRESKRLEIAHPYFAATVRDGGVTKFGASEISEQVTKGFLRAAATERILSAENNSQVKTIQDLTFLAGSQFAESTRAGIERAIAVSSGK